MSQKQSKSFTFKLAEKAEKPAQWKAREGVAVAGCTLTNFPWGREPTFDWRNLAGDGGLFC